MRTQHPSRIGCASGSAGPSDRVRPDTTSTTARASRRTLPLALFLWMALLPTGAAADDPCDGPAKEVKAILAALAKAAPGVVTGGKFVVKRLSPPHETGRFQVSYLVGGRPVYSQRIEQRDAVSEHFSASVSSKSAGMLELGYGFGAGGKVSCDYVIGRSRDTFVARRMNP